MSDLVENPRDKFSHDQVQMILFCWYLSSVNRLCCAKAEGITNSTVLVQGTLYADAFLMLEE